MASYRVFVTPTAERGIVRLPAADRRRVIAKIAALASDPRPHGAQKLTGEDKYRLRQGDYRVVYTIADEVVTVTVVRVAHRSDVYR